MRSTGFSFHVPFFPLLFVIFFLAFAQPAPKPAIALETTPFFENLGGLLAKGFIKKGDTCAIDSSIVDSTGSAWFRIARDGKSVWLYAKNIRYCSDIPRDFRAQQSLSDENKKHRLEILRNNPQWPHRIKMAVREGQICLDMTEEQLIAAWGQPFQKGSMFAVGLGTYESRFFRTMSDKILVVNLQNGRVFGWSVEK